MAKPLKSLKKSVARLTNVNKFYGEGSVKVKALDELNLAVFQGDYLAVMGASGSGKSTLIDIFTGLIKPDKGNIKCDGQDIHDDIKSWQSIIGYVPQSVYLIDDTIEKNITLNFSGMQINKTKIDDQVITEILTVNGVRFSFEDGSWGLIRASSNKPSLVIVTESPTSDDRKKKIFDFIDDLLQKTGKIGEYDQKI